MTALAYAISLGAMLLAYWAAGLWGLYGILALVLMLTIRHRLKYGIWPDGSTWDGVIPLLVKHVVERRRSRRRR